MLGYLKRTISINFKEIKGSLGVEVIGANLSVPIPETDANSMQAAIKDRLVMVIRDQNLTTLQYVESIRFLVIQCINTFQNC